MQSLFFAQIRVHSSTVSVFAEEDVKGPKASVEPAHSLFEARRINGAKVVGVVVVVVGGAVVVRVVVGGMVGVVFGSGIHDPDEHLPRARVVLQIAPSGSGKVPPH